LRNITRDAEDIQRIQKTVEAAEGYQNEMANFLKEFRRGDLACQTTMDNFRSPDLMDFNQIPIYT
ncbi:MAG: hypothetical protein R6V36_00020, partial [Psychroflexus sp.]